MSAHGHSSPVPAPEPGCSTPFIHLVLFVSVDGTSMLACSMLIFAGSLGAPLALLLHATKLQMQCPTDGDCSLLAALLAHRPES
mmetsp:Transcript_61677/g.163358  ORF Transcript_61677/g.163358 Transcript_61677/m.163358 type:complete len:84 (+) Transcript_61677:64-315(+)|eukprot:3122824-Prymnesium_polylepis.1